MFRPGINHMRAVVVFICPACCHGDEDMNFVCPQRGLGGGEVIIGKRPRRLLLGRYAHSEANEANFP